MCHGYITKMDWKDCSRIYPEIQSAVSLREVSDTSLMSTCRTLRVQKAAVDFFRELASTDGKVTVAMLEKLNGDLLNNEEMARFIVKIFRSTGPTFTILHSRKISEGGLDDLLAWVNSEEAKATAHH